MPAKKCSLKFTQVFCAFRSVPFTAVHRVKTGAFYQVFGDGHNLDVCVGVLKGHSFLSVLDLLEKIFELCVSSNLALHSLVNIVYFLAGESPVFAVEVSVAMDDCDSASFVLACPSCRVRSAIVFDMFATVSRSDWVAVARFAKA